MQLGYSLLLLSSVLVCAAGSPSAAGSSATLVEAPPPSDASVTAKAPRSAGDGRQGFDRASPAPRSVQYIIGGIVAQEGKYPFTIAIALRNVEGKLSQYCAGTLIGPKAVLTAAHCRVTGGDFAIIDRHDLRSVFKGVAVKIVGVTMHPGFNDKTFENDIAILTLARSIDGNGNPNRYVKLLERGAAIAEGTPVTALGWGATSREDSSLVLREVTLPIARQKECVDRYKDRYAIADSMVCASAPGKDTCQGDSGGPLFIKNPEGQMVQVGITSFGIGCADPRYHGVYTRVASFSSWIEQNTPK